ncbi:hypothetical protein F4779DRAFT_624133 [Xylariaceae sp. FL0662B]|nr:hypothetical protein F4779DRAFT_624133 [Xylariaceae sp. FL0662B]
MEDRACRFLQLPCELRLEIYRYALTIRCPLALALLPRPSDIPSHCHADDYHNTTPNTNSAHYERKANSDVHLIENCYDISVAVLRLNKTVYRESRPILYGENTFLVSARTASPLLKPLLPSKRFIKHVYIRVSDRTDLFEGLPTFIYNTLRYFSNLEEVRVLFPEEPAKNDWTLGNGDYVFDKTAYGSRYVKSSLSERLRALPLKANIEFTGVGNGLVDSNVGERLDAKLYEPFMK